MSQLDIKDFIRKAISDIEEALPEGYAVAEAINFEVSVIHTEKAGGGIDLKVVSGTKDAEKGITQKLNFAIVNEAKQESDSKKSSEQFIGYMVQGITELTKIGANRKDEMPHEPQ